MSRDFGYHTRSTNSPLDIMGSFGRAARGQSSKNATQSLIAKISKGPAGNKAAGLSSLKRAPGAKDIQGANKAAAGVKQEAEQAVGAKKATFEENSRIAVAVAKDVAEATPELGIDAGAVDSTFGQKSPEIQMLTAGLDAAGGGSMATHLKSASIASDLHSGSSSMSSSQRDDLIDEITVAANATPTPSEQAMQFPGTTTVTPRVDATLLAGLDAGNIGDLLDHNFLEQSEVQIDLATIKAIDGIEGNNAASKAKNKSLQGPPYGAAAIGAFAVPKEQVASMNWNTAGLDSRITPDLEGFGVAVAERLGNSTAATYDNEAGLKAMAQTASLNNEFPAPPNGTANT